MIALLVMTDGRDELLAQSWASFHMSALDDWNISERWIHDDTGDPDHAAHLRRLYPAATVIESAGRSGFGGAIRNAWRHLREHSAARFVFHLEDDFTFNGPFWLDDLAEVLAACPTLAQLAFRRQPWNAAELAAGGIIEQHPNDYNGAAMELANGRVVEWLEHRRFFTTNPSLYRRELLDRHEWPEGANSEGHFGLQLFTDPHTVCGYWGARTSNPLAHHIGTERNGTGY